MRILVTYDIPKTKIRKKVSEALEGYGVRVNLSVYECTLTKTQLKRLKAEIIALISPSRDNVRFYNVCENCLKKSYRLAKRQKAVFEGINLVF